MSEQDAIQLGHKIREDLRPDSQQAYSAAHQEIEQYYMAHRGKGSPNELAADVADIKKATDVANEGVSPDKQLHAQMKDGYLEVTYAGLYGAGTVPIFNQKDSDPDLANKEADRKAKEGKNFFQQTADALWGSILHMAEQGQIQDPSKKDKPSA